MYET
jgi:hypothetical protein